MNLRKGFHDALYYDGGREVPGPGGHLRSWVPALELLGVFPAKSVLYTLFQTGGLLPPSVTCIRTKLCLAL